jgi:hypothetical protein
MTQQVGMPISKFSSAHVCGARLNMEATGIFLCSTWQYFGT